MENVKNLICNPLTDVLFSVYSQMSVKVQSRFIGNMVLFVLHDIIRRSMISLNK